jgi:hypothetical protein
MVIPIPKPERDSTDPVNYRPISLTSYLCKTFDRMVNNPLVLHLEVKGIISGFQSCFREQLSTNKHLIHPDFLIRKSLINKQHSASI